MKTIELTQGQSAAVDDADYGALSEHLWHAKKRGGKWYAVRNVKVDGRWTKLAMHRVVAGTPQGMETDHVDGDSLNNTRANLRIVNHVQNLWNLSAKKSGCTSRFRGVHWSATKGRWLSRISVNGKRLFVGLFDCEIAAAEAYDRAGVERDPIHFTPNFQR
jgi:hypothetical protein